MVFILYNPVANNNKAAMVVEDAKKAFECGETQTADITGISVGQFMSERTGDDKVVICGGDGTLNRFVNDVGDEPLRCPVYIYKSGTGNDFIRDVTGGSEATYVQINDYIRDLPEVEINGVTRRYINGIGFGIDGQVCSVADRMKAEGKENINYAALSVKLLLHGYVCPDATVTVDGVEHSFRHVWLASAMNGRYYGGGMMAAPSQDRSGDSVSAVILSGAGKLRTLITFPKIFSGEHIKKKMTTVISGHTVTVRFTRPTALQIDGETVEGVTEYTVRKKQHAPHEQAEPAME